MSKKYQYWFACIPSITGEVKRNLLELFGKEEEIYLLTKAGEQD